jgi:hypothetical protein
VPPGDPNTPFDPADDQLADRGRALIAAAVADTRAPLALRERIEADRRRASSRGLRARRGRLVRLLLPAAGLAVAVVAAIVIAVGGGGTPSVLATASLAARGPVLPPPAEDDGHPALLKASVDGVPFPYWSDLQWKAVGARDDKIEDRAAKTVYYENPTGIRAAYTILGGDWVNPPSSSTKRTQNRVELWVTTHAGQRIVTWERSGHTCVLSAPVGVPESRLLALASWKGQGHVPF